MTLPAAPDADRPPAPDAAPRAAPHPSAADAAARPCPGCGYDLRAAAGDRCSECGLAVAAAALAVSSVPWAHRRRVGRVRAFAQTVWRVTWDAKALRHEAGRPQDPQDAARFRRCNAFAVGLALAVFAGLAVVRAGPKDLLTQPPNPFNVSRPPWPTGAAQDWVVPWAAGLTLILVPPACLAALVVYAAGAGRAVFRLGHLPAEQQARGRAVAAYAAAPWAWLAVAAVAALGLRALPDEEVWRRGPVLVEFLYSAARLAVPGLVLLAAGGAVVRTGQWAARAAHAGFGTGLLAALELVARLAVGLVVIAGVVPWCLGFAWVVVDSLR